MVGKKSRFAVALALFLAPSVALGAAVTVKGRLQGAQKLLNPVWNEAKDPSSHRYNFREPSVTTRLDARTLTAAIDKEVAIVASNDTSAGKLKGVMAIIGGRVSPVTLVVTQGESVQFENKDPFPHRLYDTGNKGLQVGDTPPNKARAWTPPAAGKYEIRDQVAPSVRGWIVVLPKASAVAYPDRKGEFAMDLDPGKYKLRAYHNGEAVGKELEITVNTAPAEQPLKAPLVVAEDAKKDDKKDEKKDEKK